MGVAHHFLATSDTLLARTARRLHRNATSFTLPAPRIIALPTRWTFVAMREIYHLSKRLLVSEPIFKSYCKQVGARVRTGPYVHYVIGEGDIYLGDDVVLDGLSVFSFAARFSEAPTLRVGNRTGIGHQCQLTIGKAITIGNDCRIGPRVWMFDSSGHATDPDARIGGVPPAADQVRPITIGNNVWVGGGSIIGPGVSIGDGAVVSAGAVVLANVPPRTVVAGNPARMVGLTSSFRSGAPTASDPPPPLRDT
ncbi:Maltose O-acetyltransferase [Minicystis rosea]|nr:Maltose O-acetyltransferase [Minicystis rosea]